jgi:hypothetical protein
MKNSEKEISKKIEIFQKNHRKSFKKKNDTTWESCCSQATPRCSGIKIKLAKISENFR